LQKKAPPGIWRGFGLLWVNKHNYQMTFVSVWVFLLFLTKLDVLGFVMMGGSVGGWGGNVNGRNQILLLSPIPAPFVVAVSPITAPCPMCYAFAYATPEKSGVAQSKKAVITCPIGKETRNATTKSVNHQDVLYVLYLSHTGSWCGASGCITAKDP
jgi:hypothetical protein